MLKISDFRRYFSSFFVTIRLLNVKLDHFWTFLSEKVRVWTKVRKNRTTWEHCQAGVRTRLEPCWARLFGIDGTALHEVVLEICQVDPGKRFVG